jgi:LacI family transcriptional regulator
MNLRDLAKRLRVSSATVSRALNSGTSKRVAEPLRGKIQALAKKLNYRPNQLARNLSKGSSQTISVIIHAMYASTFFDDCISKVVWGVHHGLSDKPDWGWKMLLLPHGKTLTDTDLQTAAGGVDGILFSAGRTENMHELRRLVRSLESQWKLQIVGLNMDPFPGTSINTVYFDNEQAGYAAAAYVLQRQYRHIGMIFADNNTPDMELRLKGYWRAMEDHHFAFDDRMVGLGDSSIKGGYEATIQLFKKPVSKKLTALLCISDEMALGVLRALRALGKRCPADVAVMGFNGEALGEFSTPSISTVTQPVFEMARSGTRLLIDVIEGRVKGPVNQTIASELISRESI